MYDYLGWERHVANNVLLIVDVQKAWGSMEKLAVEKDVANWVRRKYVGKGENDHRMCWKSYDSR